MRVALDRLSVCISSILFWQLSTLSLKYTCRLSPVSSCNKPDSLQQMAVFYKVPVLLEDPEISRDGLKISR